MKVEMYSERAAAASFGFIRFREVGKKSRNTGWRTMQTSDVTERPLATYVYLIYFSNHRMRTERASSFETSLILSFYFFAFSDILSNKIYRIKAVQLTGKMSLSAQISCFDSCVCRFVCTLSLCALFFRLSNSITFLIFALHVEFEEDIGILREVETVEENLIVCSFLHNYTQTFVRATARTVSLILLYKLYCRHSLFVPTLIN